MSSTCWSCWRSKVANRQNSFTTNPEELIDKYRLSKECIHALWEKASCTKNFLFCVYRMQHSSLPVAPQGTDVLCHKEFPGLYMADCSGMSAASVCKIIRSTSISTLLCILAQVYIKFPEPSDIPDLTSIFFYCWHARGFGLRWCLFHQYCNPWGNNAELYRSRKGGYAIDLMDICNHDLVFIFLVTLGAHAGSIFSLRFYHPQLRKNVGITLLILKPAMSLKELSVFWNACLPYSIKGCGLNFPPLRKSSWHLSFYTA